jgi:hypothetical protein
MTGLQILKRPPCEGERGRAGGGGGTSDNCGGGGSTGASAECNNVSFEMCGTAKHAPRDNIDVDIHHLVWGHALPLALSTHGGACA